MQLLYILGRQPAIGLAELESLYGSPNVAKIGREAALVTTEEAAPFSHLGSSVKESALQETVSESGWPPLERVLQKLLKKHLQTFTHSKLTIGVSVYGENIASKKLLSIGLNLKKVIKQHGLSARLVPNQDSTLSSAQVYHNKLTNDRGLEIIIYRNGSKTHVAFATNVQDIDAYTLRDRSRPKRDSRVGMLPPKLAQTIINLGTGNPQHTEKRTTHPLIVLDPFCGTGVVLQEALLMGYHAIGTDLDQRMVEYSQANIDWLSEKYPGRKGFLRYIDQGDATNMQWPEHHTIDVVACETYLGRPFTHEPDKEILFKNRNDCDTIIRKFLENIHSQLRSGARLCLGVPAWFAHGTTYHLKTLDYLEEIGYNRISFVHASDKDLVYHREDQIVGRELVVITRK